MSRSRPAGPHPAARLMLLAALAAIPTATSGGEAQGNEWTLSLAAGVPAQGGTLGDIYRRTGWLFGVDLEGVDLREGSPFYLGLDYFSFLPRKPGHVIAASKQTLTEGRTARLVLYRLGVRRILPSHGGWRRYAEIGFGPGATSAEYTTTADTTGEGGPLVADLFVGAGMRAKFRGPVGCFAGVRLDGVHALFWGQWAVVASARAGVTFSAKIPNLSWERASSRIRISRSDPPPPGDATARPADGLKLVAIRGCR